MHLPSQLRDGAARRPQERTDRSMLVLQLATAGLAFAAALLLAAAR